ncbi:MmgE/PrpD family protein [Sphingobium aromaticivastans]|uniref:MmgE/PrpD family protein n=1 Tax=Sphingobium aromaticivastans TaxID=1778665 RepID=UPI00301818B2
MSSFRPDTISGRLATWMRKAQTEGLPADVRHEAKRLFLNQLKASVGATDQQAITLLRDWAVDEAQGGTGAHVHWFGTPLPPALAAMVNGALYEVLDFHDTYIPCFMHAVSGVLPAVLAQAEASNRSGKELVSALAIGLEVELAVARILMPTGYYRGMVPAGLTGGVGAAAACAVLEGLSDEQTQHAIGIAMCTPAGIYESAGSHTLSYITGIAARSGLQAAALAKRGFTAPPTAFEGDQGMFKTHSDEDKAKIDAIIDSLGSEWRIFGQTYKVVPTETITHGPVECALEILGRANGRTVERIDLSVEQIVVKIVDGRRERFGRPSSTPQATFDLCHCVAAAWLHGQFTTEEVQADCYTDPAVIALSDKIVLTADPDRKTFEGCAMTVTFTDGSTEHHNVDNFLGTPGARVPDQKLTELLEQYGEGLLPAGRARAIADTIWALDDVDSIAPLIALINKD